MSYDLLVFEPDAAPAEREDFLAWFEELAEWSEDHDHADPQFMTSRLQAWYRDMIAVFPTMNGPDAVSDDELDNPKVSDYCLATQAAYLGFGWSQAEEAYRTSFSLAQKHGLGFFDVSAGDGGVWLPKDGGYHLVHGGGEGEQDA